MSALGNHQTSEGDEGSLYSVFFVVSGMVPTTRLRITTRKYNGKQCKRCAKWNEKLRLGCLVVVVGTNDGLVAIVGRNSEYDGVDPNTNNETNQRKADGELQHVQKRGF